MVARIYSDNRVHWFLGIAGAVTATFLLTTLHASSTTAGMVFLVLVVWTGSQAGVFLSLCIAALCAVSFDYFFLPPYRMLLLEGAQAWIAMFAFAASSLVVSRVAESARRQKLQAEQRRRDVERLYLLSQEMMLQGDAGSIIRDMPRLIGRIFELEAVALFVRERDQTYASPGEVPASVEAGLRAMTQGLQPIVDLTLDFHAAWLALGLRPVGALAWRPGALSKEVSAAVAAQVAIVLARAITMEASARMEAAREAERLRTALVDSLTHELRTPLTSIRAASTTLLEGGELDEALRLDMVKIIDEESARLDRLIGESVEMAEIDANVLEVRLAPQHPRAFLEETVEQSRKVLAGRKVSIVADEPDTPAWFDARLLGRVLRHLLENAASYTAAGSRIKLIGRRNGDRLEFSVEDNGPGIDALDLPLIFDKFYRGKRGAEARKGSGMGLAIARAILVAHGGSIEAKSEVGAGARFICWVPLVEKDPQRGQAGALPQAESAGEAARQG